MGPSLPPKALVLATHNRHKVVEIKAILHKAGLRMKILTLDDFPKFRPVVEDRRTIEGNAIQKAREVSRRTGHLALADDTGLFIEALKGRPGVYSARFAGKGCTYQDNNEKALRLLRGIPSKKRRAVFRCIAALASPKGTCSIVEGRIVGRITSQTCGAKGFGYDPIFVVPAYRKTFAELGPRLKNRISHRARAFRQIPGLLKRLLLNSKS